MAGITRIHIDSNWHDWRTQMAVDLAPAADRIYRNWFKRMEIPLAVGTETVNVTKDEAMSRYDWSEGIDVILESLSGARMTLQEKFLTWKEDTVTFEEIKTSGARGAWYYCTAQYYFVGYARKYLDWRTQQVLKNAVLDFQAWRLVDFPAIRRAEGRITWHYKDNTRDGRRARFRYVYFNDIPREAVIAPFTAADERDERMNRYP